MNKKLIQAKIKRKRKALENDSIAALSAQIAQLNQLLNNKPEIDLSELIKQVETIPLTLAKPITEKLNSLVKTIENRPKDVLTEKDLAKLLKGIKLETKNIDITSLQKGLKELTKQVKERSQKPEDFLPYRRVVKIGNQFMFDDNITGVSGGGGVDTSELATSAKQDDIITAIEGISGGSGTPLDVYSYIQKDTSGATYKYYGYADANTAGGWLIKRITIATNLAEFVKGTTGYSAAWTARNDGVTHTYADIWSVF